MKTKTSWSGDSREFDRLMQRWLTAAKIVLPETQRIYHWLAVEAFIAWNGRQRVDRARLEEYVAQVMTRYDQRRADRAVISLRFVLQHLAGKSPAVGLKVGRKIRQTSEMQVASFDQMAHVRHHYSRAGTSKFEPDRWLVITLMWECGLAAIDALQLRWEQIDLDRLVISAQRQKSKHGYIVPFERGGELHRLLVEREDRTGPVFQRYSINSHFQRIQLNQQLAPFFRQAGIGKGNSTHCFRRAFITRHIRAGTSPVLIARMVGHSGLDLIIDYSKNTVEDLTMAVDEARTKLARVAGSHKSQGVSYAGPPARPPAPATYFSRIGRARRNASTDLRPVEPARQLGDPDGRSDGEVPAGVRGDTAEPVAGGCVLPAECRSFEATADAPAVGPSVQPPVSGEAAWAV